MAILRKPEHFWPALWVGISAALFAVIAAEFEFGQVSAGGGPRTPAKVVEAKLLPAFALAPEAQSAPETVARPLFVPTRRPAPPANVSAAQTMKRGQFVLTGVTVTPELSFAFLKEIANGKTLSVKKGSQVNGLAIDTVEPRRVVLRQGDETEELALNVQVPARMAATGAPTSGAPPAPGVQNIFAGMPTAGAVQPGSTPTQATPGGAGAPAVGAVPGAAPAAGAAPGAAVQPGVPAVPSPATGRRRPWINAQ